MFKKRMSLAFLPLALVVASFFLFSMSDKSQMVKAGSSVNQSELKEAAFAILESKCNTCHIKQNPFKVFSLRNMERFAPKIEKQVFTLKRMPKGNKVKLTTTERETLYNWILSTR